LPEEEGRPDDGPREGGGSPVEQQGVVRRSRGESTASMAREMHGPRRVLLLRRQGDTATLEILETVRTVPCTSRARVAPCFLRRRLGDAPHLGAAAHSSTGQARRGPRLLCADLARSSFAGPWRLHLGQLHRWRVGRQRSRGGALAACRSGGRRSSDGGPPHLRLLPLSRRRSQHRRRPRFLLCTGDAPFHFPCSRGSEAARRRGAPLRSPGPVRRRGTDEGAAHSRSRCLFFSPFRLSARTNRRCAGPHHTILSHESVCTGK
jgi:hypothetical protein